MKADDPTQIHGRTWAYLLRRAAREFLRTDYLDAAAALTFFSVLSIFPAGLGAAALIGVLGDSTAVLDRMLALLNGLVPAAVTETLRLVLTDVTGAPTARLTLAVSVAIALWSASTYVSAFGRAVNRIYGVEEGRPYWKRKPAQLVLTAGLILLVIVVGAIVVLSGPTARAVGRALGVGETALLVWDVLKWPVLAVALVVMVAVLYKGTGNALLPRFRWLSLGALCAILVMALASIAFGFYVANFADYNRTFGALTTVIIFLIWLFLINLSLLFGAKFNAELERGRQLQAGVHAEVEIRLEPRDVRLRERRDELDQVTEEHGVLLRQGESPPARTDTMLARVRRAIRRVWRRGRPRE